MEKPNNKNLAIALAVCLGLCALTVFAPMYPCGYNDATGGAYAGHGYHSLVKVASEGFQWESGTVPVQWEIYTGSGPYVASAEYWVAILYIPIFLAIIYLGIMLATGRISGKFIHLSKRSE